MSRMSRCGKISPLGPSRSFRVNSSEVFSAFEGHEGLVSWCVTRGLIIFLWILIWHGKCLKGFNLDDSPPDCSVENLRRMPLMIRFS